MLTRKKVGFSAAALFFSVSLSACAGPPLQLYTLGGAATPAGQAQGLVAPGTPVLEIRRVSLPDYLDTQDIVVRNGQSLDRSPNGRWAERLSDGITDFIVARVGSARPDIFVTGQSLTGPATARLAISITRLDVAASGTAILEASWAVIPADEHQPEGQLQRGTISVSGPSKTDANIVTLTNTLIRQLSDRITQSLPARL
ncbi:PqiC family protein [Acetobacter fallax]|uniref:ABC-type transport auxiliary lipoprotein component domain-containing protein n=2 Tax=Acetobacter fallax TaxID=1737473 RepID=A0ABX0K773_9PROT|nr:PqiC family protein [Acetobacter fallax]NHO31068.1 hypothetical protein [Acetobacter fallax]NHO34625.1 hypothetical protein [Acetobacter fallax]